MSIIMQVPSCNLTLNFLDGAGVARAITEIPGADLARTKAYYLAKPGWSFVSQGASWVTVGEGTERRTGMRLYNTEDGTWTMVP
jgi:hypothetical protein